MFKEPGAPLPVPLVELRSIPHRPATLSIPTRPKADTMIAAPGACWHTVRIDPGLRIQHGVG